jgi:hypothetical protein
MLMTLATGAPRTSGCLSQAYPERKIAEAMSFRSEVGVAFPRGGSKRSTMAESEIAYVSPKPLSI